MAYSAPNPAVYSSNLYPISTRSVIVKRGDGGPLAASYGSGSAGGGTATTVGTYLLENFNVVRPSIMVDRKGVYGEDKGEPRIIRNKLTCSTTAQIDLTTTNEIHAGDYFEEIVDVESGAASANKVRFIIDSVTHNASAGSPHTFSLSGAEDMVHSSQYGGS